MLKQVAVIVMKLVLLARRIIRRLLIYLYRPLFKRHGINFIFDPYGEYSYETISIGDDVFIGGGARFHSITSISIGNKVMFGPGVIIMGGNHNIHEVGCFMSDVIVKRPEDDLPISIGDDVWVGAGAIILKGVNIGRGCVIGAGAVVTKSLPAYTIYTGVQNSRLRLRWDMETILFHEKKLYSEAERMPSKILKRSGVLVDNWGKKDEATRP